MIFASHVEDMDIGGKENCKSFQTGGHSRFFNKRQPYFNQAFFQQRNQYQVQQGNQLQQTEEKCEE